MKTKLLLVLLASFAIAETGKKSIHDEPLVAPKEGENRKKLPVLRRDPAVLNLNPKDPSKENPSWPYDEGDFIDNEGYLKANEEKLKNREYHFSDYRVVGKTVFLFGGPLTAVLSCSGNSRLLISGSREVNASAVATNPKDRDYTFTDKSHCENARKVLLSKKGQPITTAVIETRGRVATRVDIR